MAGRRKPSKPVDTEALTESGRVIVALTVREILDEQLAKKLA